MTTSFIFLFPNSSVMILPFSLRIGWSWLRIAPNPVEQASVCNIRGLLSIGQAKIGEVVSFLLRVWKASSALVVYLNDVSCLRVALMGAAILEKSLMNNQ